MLSDISHAAQDYLRIIYDITAVHSQARAATTELAGRLSVKPSSVTGMLQKLAENDPPLIDYQKHHGVRLTEDGCRVALEIIRHHRLLETFLHDFLGYSWDEVHEEADRLEHVISEELEERIAALLGHPGHDPHGDPIPGRDLTLPPQTSINLRQLSPGQQATVQRIRDDDAALLSHLADLGLVPQARFTLLEHLPFDENVRLQIAGGGTVVIGPQVSGQIYVDPETDREA